MNGADATAVSLVENIHRADMNPRDKAIAFKALVGKFGDMQSVSRETGVGVQTDRKSTRLNSSHLVISYAVFCLKKKNDSCTCSVYSRRCAPVCPSPTFTPITITETSRFAPRTRTSALMSAPRVTPILMPACLQP